MQKYQKDLRANTNASTRLSKAQEAVLATAAMGGDIASRNKLIEHSLPFAIKQATDFHRTSNTTLDLEELVSAANVALINAANAFDPSYGVKFITYAVHKIRAALADANYSRFVVHTPIAQKRCYSQSIDQAYDKEGVKFVGETFESDNISADELVDINASKDRLIDAIDQLDTRSKDIINAYFHLDGNYDVKPTDMITKYNITGERVRGIKNQILNNLKLQLC